MPILRNTKLLISQYFGQRPGLGGFFGCLIWPNIILSRFNKICINSGTIGRHCGGNLMVEFHSKDPTVLRDINCNYTNYIIIYITTDCYNILLNIFIL